MKRKFGNKAQVLGLLLYLSCFFSIQSQAESANNGKDNPVQSSTKSANNGQYTLEWCIREAIENNPTLKGAKWEVQSKRERIRQARSIFIPDISWTATKSQSHIRESLSTENTYRSVLTLEQPLWTGGSTQVAWEMAKLELAIAQTQEYNARLEVLYGIINGFFGVLRAASGVEVATEGLRLIQEHLSVAQARLKAGATVATDVLRAEVQEAAMEESLLSAKAAKYQALQMLGAIIGRPLPENSTFHWEPREKEIQDLEYYLELLEESPSVKLGKMGCSMAYNYFRLSRAGLRPSIVLQGSITDSSGNWVPNHENRVENVTILLNFNILDGGLIKGQINEAQAQSNKAKEDFNNALNGLRALVHSDHKALTVALSKIQVTDKGLKSAQENLKITENRYSAGTALSVEVIEDQLNLVKAKNAKNDAVYAFEIALATLYDRCGITDSFWPISADLLSGE